MDLEGLLTELGGRNGSDLHLKAGRPPLFRLSGDLLPQPYPEVTPAEMREALWAIMPKPVQRGFDETLEADFSYEVPNVARFRVNVFTQRGSLGACFRLIPIEVPTIERLGLPLGVVSRRAAQPERAGRRRWVYGRRRQVTWGSGERGGIAGSRRRPPWSSRRLKRRTGAISADDADVRRPVLSLRTEVRPS